MIRDIPFDNVKRTNAQIEYISASMAELCYDLIQNHYVNDTCNEK